MKYVPLDIQIQISWTLCLTGNRISLETPNSIKNMKCKVKTLSCNPLPIIRQKKKNVNSFFFFLLTSVDDKVPSILRHSAGKTSTRRQEKIINWRSTAIIRLVITPINKHLLLTQPPLPLVELSSLCEIQWSGTDIYTRGLCCVETPSTSKSRVDLARMVGPSYPISIHWYVFYSVFCFLSYLVKNKEKD